MSLDKVLHILEENGMSELDIDFFEKEILKNPHYCDSETRMVYYMYFLSDL